MFILFNHIKAQIFHLLIYKNSGLPLPCVGGHGLI